MELGEKEMRGLISKLAKKGKSLSEIGMILKEKHGIEVRKAIGKKMLKLARELKVAPKLPEDLASLIKRAINLRKHLSGHRKDYHSARGLLQIESKIKALAKYYKRKKVLPKDWEYAPERAELLLK